ncbi:MAG: ABC transporter permease [Prevotella sp.]|nr:ABC transporter permease [Prevotella sp.]
MRDLIEEIWATTRRNKLRTALTGFAVAWGIFMLIVLLGAGNGLINANEQNNNRSIDNSMTIYGGYTSKAYKGYDMNREIALRDEDFRITKQKFDDVVDEIGAQISQDGLVITLGENYFSGSLTGVYPIYNKINKMDMLYGRFINDIDNKERRKVLVVNDTQAKELLGHDDAASIVGRRVEVGQLSFEIVGVYKDKQNGMRASSIFTAYNTIRTLYNKGDYAGNIVFTFHGLNSQKENEDWEKKYRATINKLHGADPTDEDAIWISNGFTQMLQMQTGSNIIRTALWIIGLLTLLSGIVGVGNIMLITVKERTREFGIRKAIGAKPLSILRLIILESIIITTFFGYIGMVLGMLANIYMDATIGHDVIDTGIFKTTLFVDPTVGLGTCIAATVVMILAGTFAGILPARKAAKVRPIEALRAE